MEKEKIMEDGELGLLTRSERYYCTYPNVEATTVINYYTLSGERIHLPSGTCSKCGEFIQSLRCGHFVSCKCGGSFVDTDRWMPERGRYGGSLANL